MKHNIFQFEQNFLTYKPKPIDLFLFSLPLNSKVGYSHKMSVLLRFQTSGQLKVQCTQDVPSGVSFTNGGCKHGFKAV